MMPIDPVTLAGTHVRLEPLTLDHLDALCEVGLDPELWARTTTLVRGRDDLARWLRAALADRDAGTALPFATIERSSNRVVGSSRLATWSPEHRRIEIGWTWIARPWQRTAINTEAKYLMLRHAFEVMHCVRVELKTDVINSRSRAAMLRIGAVEEGIHRKHMITESGRRRDSVFFSIIDDEWPAVRTRLEARLAAPRAR